MSRGEKQVIAGIAVAFVVFFSALVWFAARNHREGEARCATIGAAYHAGGRGTAFCTKADGSMWRVP